MYNSIDVEVLKPLIKQGLCVNKMAKVTGYSKTGIKLFCERHGIDTVDGKHKKIIVNGVKMSLVTACVLNGFTREAMYSHRVNRGLSEQEGFDSYVEYKKTGKLSKTVNSKTATVIFRNKKQLVVDVKNTLNLSERFLVFMKHNKYKQQAFDRYLYTRGIK